MPWYEDDMLSGVVFAVILVIVLLISTWMYTIDEETGRADYTPSILLVSAWFIIVLTWVFGRRVRRRNEESMEELLRRRRSRTPFTRSKSDGDMGKR